jgi:hypothetical protein
MPSPTYAALEEGTARTTIERDVSEILKRRADLLPPDDRALLAVYLEAGTSLSQIARLTGESKSTICRRVRRILRRLTDETYLLCLRHRDRFTRREMALLHDYFIGGLSMRRITRDRHINYYRVRAAVDRARRLARAHAAENDWQERGMR